MGSDWLAALPPGSALWVAAAFLAGAAVAVALVAGGRAGRRAHRCADPCRLARRPARGHRRASGRRAGPRVKRRDLKAAEAAVQARLDEARRGFADKEALFRETGDALKLEFERLANRVLERQGERHQASLGQMLTPFKEQLADFRKRVETVYTTETRDRASLLAEVRNLQQASERINREAENLTRALKGDVKVQGNWGEMVLERVLESSGLRPGEEYVLQSAHRDDAGALKRPDVVIRLPDDKDVVVDAKLSLAAYEQALAEEDAAARDASRRAPTSPACVRMSSASPIRTTTACAASARSTSC
jgi:DNA anti-recombination protein RmuC